MAEYMEYEWRAQSADVLRTGHVAEHRRSARRDPEQRKVFLAELRRELTHLSVKDETDVSLQRYLYARKWDLEAARELLLAHHRYRLRNPEVFSDLSLEANDVRASLVDGLPGVLEERDRRGRRVLLVQAARWDCTKYPLLSVYRALLLSLDSLTQDVETQANGLVVIVDWTEVGTRQAVQLRPRILRLMVEGLQDCYPVRFKAVHHVNQTWYVSAALALLRQLVLREKSRERMHTHGNNLSTLHEHVPTDILPTELGGERPSYDPRLWLEHLLPASCPLTHVNK